MFFETLKNKEYYFQELFLKLNFTHTGQAVEEGQVLGTSDNTHDACPESGDHMGTRGAVTSSLSEESRHGTLAQNTPTRFVNIQNNPDSHLLKNDSI